MPPSEPASSYLEEGCSILTPSVSTGNNTPMDIGVLLNNGTLNTQTQGMKLKLLNHTPDTNFKLSHKVH